MEYWYTIGEIEEVVLNQGIVPDSFLEKYDKQCTDAYFNMSSAADGLLEALVEIVAIAQGVDPKNPYVIQLVRSNIDKWHYWVVLARHYREWEKQLKRSRR